MNLLVVDDHALFREGLTHVLTGLASGVKVIEAADARTALATLQQRDDLDLVLVDLALPDAKPFDVLEAARRLQPSVPVVVISAAESRIEIDRAMSLGAQGYVFKSSPGQALLSALRRVVNGELVFPERAGELPDAPLVALTERQLEVLKLLARGISNRDIALTLDVAENTVKVHLQTIYKLLGVQNRTAALLKAQTLGLVREAG
ncbi:MAG: response regulator transcription factor [Myxococcaceae bacterium]|nr:response regulator transcription factor [Myxococcaceae bacterium]